MQGANRVLCYSYKLYGFALLNQVKSKWHWTNSLLTNHKGNQVVTRFHRYIHFFHCHTLMQVSFARLPLFLVAVHFESPDIKTYNPSPYFVIPNVKSLASITHLTDLKLGWYYKIIKWVDCLKIFKLLNFDTCRWKLIYVPISTG